MDLAEHQQSLLHLISGRQMPSITDPYLQAVADSPQLSLLRRVVLLWRIYDLDHMCALTSGYLKLVGAFQETVERFIAATELTPYIDQLGERFLTFLVQQSDPRLAALARSEAALLRVARGEAQREVIAWPCDPNPILAASLRQEPRLLTTPDAPYRMTVDATLPHYYIVEPGVIRVSIEL